MEFGRILRVLSRRWLILAIGLLVSAGAAVGAYSNAPRSYEANSRLVVLMPPTAESPTLLTSPFFDVPGGINVLARVISFIPNSPEFRAAMVRDGFEPDYTLAVERNSSIVNISVTSDDPTKALRTRDELMRRLAAELKRVQTDEGAPERQLARSRVVGAPSNVTTVDSEGFRAAATAALVGTLLTLLVIGLIERRSTTRSRKASTVGTGTPGPAGAAPDREAPDPDRESRASEEASPLLVR